MFIKKSGVLQILLGLSIKLIVLSENAYASSAILRRSIVLRRGFSTTMPTNRTVDWIMFLKGGIVSPYPPANWIPQLLVAPPCPTTTTTSVSGLCNTSTDNCHRPAPTVNTDKLREILKLKAWLWDRSYGKRT